MNCIPFLFKRSTIHFPDHAAADHDVAIVEDDCLTNGESPHRLVEDDLHPSVREDGGGAGGLFGLVAVLRLAADGLGGGVDCRPVEGIGDQPGGEELGIAYQAQELIDLNLKD